MRITNHKELSELIEPFPISVAYLFGSQKRGSELPTSDLDIGIFFHYTVLTSDFSALEDKLRDALEGHFGIDVDIVNLNVLDDPLLKYEVVLEGLPLLIRDRDIYNSLQISTLKEYEDTAHLRFVNYSAMRRQIRDGCFGKPNLS